MNVRKSLLPMAGALLASLWSFAAGADANKIIIGDIDDISGIYADLGGQGSIESAKMAIAEFGGSVLDRPIELLTYDHQNKPDLAVQKLREWAERGGLNMLLSSANTGVSIAMSAVVEKERFHFSR